MNNILQAAYSTVNKSKTLLSKLSNAELCNDEVPPYYSSIGSHVRHILDFYNCIFNGIPNDLIDLTNRDRNEEVERNCDCAGQYIDAILDQLKNVRFEGNKPIVVLDDLGQGTVKIEYTIGAIFAQANSHTIHHYAIINYILDRLGIQIDDENFGFNPTSPKKEFNTN